MLLPIPHHGQVTLFAEGAKAVVYLAAVEDAIAVEVELPQTRGGIEDADFRCSRTVPIADDGQIRGRAEGTKTAVDGTALPLAIPIFVQFPLPGDGIKQAQLGDARPSPIAGYGQPVGVEERPTPVLQTLVPDTVPVAVQVPPVGGGAVETDRIGGGAARPPADHGEVRPAAERAEAEVDGASFPAIIAVVVQEPEARLGIVETELRHAVAEPVADDGPEFGVAEGRTPAIDAVVQDAVAVEIQEPLPGAVDANPGSHWLHKGRGAGFGGIDGDRAVTAIGVSTPAGERRSRQGDCGEGDEGALGVGFGTIRATVNPRAGDVPTAIACFDDGKSVGRGCEEAEGGGAGFGGGHGHLAITTIRIATPPGEG